MPDRPLPPGPIRADCPCGCGAYGLLSKRTGHVKRICECRPCLGGRNRRAGMKKQRQAKKSLGIPDNKFHSMDGNEEAWIGAVRIEVKSGKQVGAVAQFLRAERQSEKSRAIGDSRPFAFVQMPSGMGREGFVTMRLSAWNTYIGPLLERGS